MRCYSFIAPPETDLWTFGAAHREAMPHAARVGGATPPEETKQKKKRLNALAEISQLACATPFSEPEAERPPDANVLTDTRPVPSQVIMLSMQTTFAGMASAFNAPVVPSQSYQGESYANPGVIGAVVSATFGPSRTWQGRKASDDVRVAASGGLAVCSDVSV